MGGIMMIVKFVGVVFFKDQFHSEVSELLDGYYEAIDFIEGCHSNEAFDYGIVETRFVKGEAQGTNSLDTGEAE